MELSDNPRVGKFRIRIASSPAAAQGANPSKGWREILTSLKSWTLPGISVEVEDVSASFRITERKLVSLNSKTRRKQTKGKEEGEGGSFVTSLLCTLGGGVNDGSGGSSNDRSLPSIGEGVASVASALQQLVRRLGFLVKGVKLKVELPQTASPDPSHDSPLSTSSIVICLQSLEYKDVTQPDTKSSSIKSFSMQGLSVELSSDSNSCDASGLKSHQSILWQDDATLGISAEANLCLHWTMDYRNLSLPPSLERLRVEIKLSPILFTIPATSSCLKSILSLISASTETNNESSISTSSLASHFKPRPEATPWGQRSLMQLMSPETGGLEEILRSAEEDDSAFFTPSSSIYEEGPREVVPHLSLEVQGSKVSFILLYDEELRNGKTSEASGIHLSMESLRASVSQAPPSFTSHPSPVELSIDLGWILMVEKVAADQSDWGLESSKIPGRLPQAGLDGFRPTPESLGIFPFQPNAGTLEDPAAMITLPMICCASLADRPSLSLSLSLPTSSSSYQEQMKADLIMLPVTLWASLPSINRALSSLQGLGADSDIHPLGTNQEVSSLALTASISHLCVIALVPCGSRGGDSFAGFLAVDIHSEAKRSPLLSVDQSKRDQREISLQCNEVSVYLQPLISSEPSAASNARPLIHLLPHGASHQIRHQSGYELLEAAMDASSSESNHDQGKVYCSFALQIKLTDRTRIKGQREGLACRDVLLMMEQHSQATSEAEEMEGWGEGDRHMSPDHGGKSRSTPIAQSRKNECAMQLSVLFLNALAEIDSSDVSAINSLLHHMAPAAPPSPPAPSSTSTSPSIAIEIKGRAACLIDASHTQLSIVPEHKPPHLFALAAHQFLISHFTVHDPSGPHGGSLTSVQLDGLALLQDKQLPYWITDHNVGSAHECLLYIPAVPSSSGSSCINILLLSGPLLKSYLSLRITGLTLSTDFGVIYGFTWAERLSSIFRPSGDDSSPPLDVSQENNKASSMRISVCLEHSSLRHEPAPYPHDSPSTPSPHTTISLLVSIGSLRLSLPDLSSNQIPISLRSLSVLLCPSDLRKGSWAPHEPCSSYTRLPLNKDHSNVLLETGLDCVLKESGLQINILISPPSSLTGHGPKIEVEVTNQQMMGSLTSQSLAHLLLLGSQVSSYIPPHLPPVSSNHLKQTSKGRKDHKEGCSAVPSSSLAANSADSTFFEGGGQCQGQWSGGSLMDLFFSSQKDEHQTLLGAGNASIMVSVDQDCDEEWDGEGEGEGEGEGLSDTPSSSSHSEVLVEEAEAYPPITSQRNNLNPKVSIQRTSDDMAFVGEGTTRGYHSSSRVPFVGEGTTRGYHSSSRVPFVGEGRWFPGACEGQRVAEGFLDSRAPAVVEEEKGWELIAGSRSKLLELAVQRPKPVHYDKMSSLAKAGRWLNNPNPNLEASADEKSPSMALVERYLETKEEEGEGEQEGRNRGPPVTRIAFKGLSGLWVIKAASPPPPPSYSSMTPPPSSSIAVIEVQVDGLSITSESYDAHESLANHTRIQIHDLIVRDRHSSPSPRGRGGNGLRGGDGLERDSKRAGEILSLSCSKGRSRDSRTPFLNLVLQSIRPIPIEAPEQLEMRLDISLLPLRLDISADLILFASTLSQSVRMQERLLPTLMAAASLQLHLLHRHHQDRLNQELEKAIDTSKGSSYSSGPDLPVPLVPFFQHVSIRGTRLEIRHRSRIVDITALSRGSTLELLNLIPWCGVELDLVGINLVGTRGWDGVGLGAMNQYLRDVTRNQLSKFLKGISPVKSISRASNAVKVLFASVPMGAIQQRRTSGVGSRGSSGRGGMSRRPSIVDEALSSLSALTAMSQRVNQTLKISPMAIEVNRRVKELSRRLVAEALRQSQAIAVRMRGKGEAAACPDLEEDIEIIEAATHD